MVTDHLPLTVLLAERIRGPDPVGTRLALSIPSHAHFVAFDHRQVVADSKVQVDSFGVAAQLLAGQFGKGRLDLIPTGQNPTQGPMQVTLSVCDQTLGYPCR